jgi:NAD-dependent deacetylase
MKFPKELVDCLVRARHVVVFTGAGVSAESGVPTFRDALTGLWARFKAEDLATPDAFLADPRLVWDWYAWRRELVYQVEPNPAHRAIAELQLRVPKLTLITQNVDGLHQRAGSREVLELHGNLQRVKCFERHHPAATWDDTTEKPPRCVLCGSWLRPDVVWFNEDLPAETWGKAQDAAADCDVLFAIGTSMLVYPAAALPLTALQAGIPVIQINPAPTDLDRQARFNLRGKAGEILPTLLDAVRGQPR